MKNLTPPLPERTYTIEVNKSELMRIIALAYRYDSPRTLPPEIAASPYLDFETNFPEEYDEAIEICNNDPQTYTTLDFFFK